MAMFWITIIIFTFLTSIVFGIGGYIISHYWLIRQNNPDRATVFIEGITRPYKARLHSTSQKGQEFIYNHGKSVVFIPTEYKTVFHNYRRDIFLNTNKDLIAIPFGNDKLPTANQKNDLIRELVQSDIGASAIRAIKSKQSISIGIIMFIAIAVIVAGGIGYVIAKSQTPTTVTTTSKPTKTIQTENTTTVLPSSGEIKIGGKSE